ncbi:glycosyltransferase family 4 protein [Amniculicola lignicola CBS 123094]|uniref:Glycosyltransferase family 4 protein n=1 Tax=Amniculicola lignicola CBS 123094 TaxID=1392246 RepID=A0A6A5WCU7_9PLEO|nr:glycosyltransferase family 4 protein [Amniculicola lignicola CBS 123094]
MGRELLGLSAIGWNAMIDGWWNKTISGFLLASILIGTLYFAVSLVFRIRKYMKGRAKDTTIPAPVATFFARLSTKLTPIRSKKPSSTELKSFGVFLGGFSIPPTREELQVLSQWDVVVLNPLANGVSQALSTATTSAIHRLGRISVRTISDPAKVVDSGAIIASLEKCIAVITKQFDPYGSGSLYTGILLADFAEHFQPPVLNELIKYLNAIGLDVWLELSQPCYLSDRQGKEINFKAIEGNVYRNATIRTDGEQQNFHMMEGLRKAQRAVAAQRVPHGPRMMIWETIHDEFPHQYAVTARGFNWSTFNSALPWIGSSNALTDATLAAARSIQQKPLGAMMFLKDDKNMEAHNQWRENDKIKPVSEENDHLFDSVHAFVPELNQKLQFIPSVNGAGKDSASVAMRKHHIRYSQALKSVHTSPLSLAMTGEDMTGHGCFQLGLDVSAQSFVHLVKAQRHLKELDLLHNLSTDELHDIGEQLRILGRARDSRAITPSVQVAIDELLTMLAEAENPDCEFPRLNVYVGLHSGFQTGADEQFWGLYDADPISGQVTIFLSKFAEHRESVLLHTFLSSRGCTRVECFMAEFALSQQSSTLEPDWFLPLRLVKDLKKLSPTEAIMLRRHLSVKREEDSFLLTAIRTCCEYQLIDIPNLGQLRAENSEAYIRGKISPDALIRSRLAWLESKGYWHPDPEAVVEIFEEAGTRLHEMLMQGESKLYAQLGSVLQATLKAGEIDPRADIFALAVFSAFRKLAIDELYLEILDRNAFPNHAADQAGCFAENFGVGSRCDSFFDFTPRVLGEILSDRYRAYFMQHQPPSRIDGYTELPTTFAAMQIDSDPDYGNQKTPVFYQLTFLGIFAVPALIDIGMLTTIGRGLYLTTFMSSTQKTMATTALMLALIVCGAVGSWITSGGCYYIYASAFPAMNMFVLTRFIAGLAVVSLGSILSFIVVSILEGVTNALVFVFYFCMLSIYLMLLSSLSIYQMPGQAFQSGRTVIMRCIPILFISPVVTIFVQHDIAVYVTVLTVFLCSLVYGARKVMIQWSSWYLHIPSVKDSEVEDWYAEKKGISKDSEKFSILAQADEPRRTLQAAIVKECDRSFWNSATKDPLISRLSAGYTSTKFLMSWYCRHRRTAMPLPYSPTWNLTLKAGLENITNMQKGLKLHSSFLHWRQTGTDVWSGVLYFVVALIDKWAALVSGGAMVGLSAASSEEYRLAVGFGLSYYLIGAVSLDTVSQPLWTAANEKVDQIITSLDYLRQAGKNDDKARRKLYWTNFVKFLCLHIWGITITSALMWIFNQSRDAVIMYIAYVSAYSGLLLYQYNKIYVGNNGAQSLAIASVLGLPAGILLHVLLPNFAYSGVLALGFGTWVSALHSWTLCGIGWTMPWKKQPKPTAASSDPSTPEKDDLWYSYGSLDGAAELSQATLAKMFESIHALPEERRFRLKPTEHPGARIFEHISRKARSMRNESVEAAFWSAEDMLQQTTDLWTSGNTVVELVGKRYFPRSDPKMRMLSKRTNGILYIAIAVGKEVDSPEWLMDIHRSSIIVAESITQATCENHLGFSRTHAMLAQTLVAEDTIYEGPTIPEGIKERLESSATERAHVIKSSDALFLRYLLLDVDCDTEWDNLPGTIRSALLKRLSGQTSDLSAEEKAWILKKQTSVNVIDPEEYVARCILAARLTLWTKDYISTCEHTNAYQIDKDADESSQYRLLRPTSGRQSLPRYIIVRVVQLWKACIKFVILSLTSDPEYQRELDYVTKSQPLVIRRTITFALNSVWWYCKILQQLIIPLVLFSGREKVGTLRQNMSGMKTVLKKNRVIIESIHGPSTCFWARQSDGNLWLSQYTGRHTTLPSDAKQLSAVNVYGKRFLLLSREVYKGGKLAQSFEYEYAADATKRGPRLPIQRRCTSGDEEGHIAVYDYRGFITSGSTFRGVNPVSFTYWYRRSAKHDDELLRGEYVFPHITIRIMWSMPPRKRPERLDDWIPFNKVAEATFIQGADVYHATWAYEHKLHPRITTTLNGELIDTPAMITEDWFHVIAKPKNCSFLSDNPLLAFSSIKSSFVSRALGFTTKNYPISTAYARTQLWREWKNGRDLDAITACFLDERLMRSEKSLKPYWRNRDLGLLERAKSYLDGQADTIMARTDFDPDISAWVHVAFKIADLYSFGQGGDSTINTRTPGMVADTHDELHVLAMDTSTWPMEPGGVSACRRDMVNDLKTTKWHIVAEMANDYGVPRFQIERNVKSLTILPLWGLDFLNPTHGVLQNSLDSAVVERSYDTRDADIETHFIPILSSLVRCARAIHTTRVIIEEATSALVDLNTYFESSRNWNDVWNSEIVKQTWRELWLTEDQPDTLTVSQWWDFEKPTLHQLDQALNMWHRYLFILALPVPEVVPDVFQASHHFTGATYGILCKIKRNCTLHVWDHCISFREFTTFMSSAVSFDMPFVNSSLMSLGHLACVLLEHHADVVLPCADYFNPGWEVELGTANGVLEHRRTFARKIDPVVNGICNMEKFEPIKEIKTDTPTAVMLSHVQFVKDIKNAILATDLIVNKWGFKDYKLHVYGDMERAAGHSAECQELIASKGLSENCVLKGLGNPSLVLQDAWLFLNSSISEGLPLAMGEAALTGVPVVCTDVGASFCVVTDRRTGDKFSEVVPPNDSESLARAQINILALLGKWAPHAEDTPDTVAPVLSYPNPTPTEVQAISDRMYAKREQRRKLGMKGRDNVLSNFSSHRYLREHEQMLWIGKHRSPAYRQRRAAEIQVSSSNGSMNFMSKEKFTFGASYNSPIGTPRLTPDRWDSAPSTRASSFISLKERFSYIR